MKKKNRRKDHATPSPKSIYHLPRIGKRTFAEIVGCAPETLHLSQTETGKPVVAPSVESNFRLDFNLSHAGEWCLLVIGRDCQVGIDIEHIQFKPTHRRIADRFFTKKEAKHINQLTGDAHHIAFFRTWTHKEAYIKARGLGLRIPLDSFEINLRTLAKRAAQKDPLPDNTLNWIVRRWLLQTTIRPRLPILVTKKRFVVTEHLL